MKCIPIFTPPNRTFYDLIFAPSRIENRRGLFNFLGQKINSTHLINGIIKKTPPSANIQPSVEHMLNNPSIMKYISSNTNSPAFSRLNFSLVSIYEMSQYMVIMSAYYRILQILSISLQHRITLSHLSKPVKFMLTGTTSLAPIFAMSFLGYSSIELGMMSLLVAISPYILNNNWSNKIREIDLISTTKKFIFKNSAINNCLSSIRNLSVILLKYLISTSIFSLFCFTSMMDPELLTAVEALDKSLDAMNHDIKICIHTNMSFPITFYSVYTPSHCVANLLSVEAAWYVGRLAIDLGIGLLQKINIISDARDPFYNRTFKKHIALNSNANVASITLAPQKLKTAIPQFNQNEEAATIDNTYSSEQSHSSKPLKRKKTHNKQTPHTTIHASKPPFSKDTGTKARDIIEIPDYPKQPLVPFFPSPHAEQAYGVVANAKTRHFELYTTTLSNAYNKVAHDGGLIKCVAPQEQVYSIRPKQTDTRLIGQRVGGKKLVKALKDTYGYDRAWLAMEILENNSTIVPFEKEANHAQLSKTIDRFRNHSLER